MKKILISLFIATMLVFNSCENTDSVVEEEKTTDENIFKNTNCLGTLDFSKLQKMNDPQDANFNLSTQKEVTIKVYFNILYTGKASLISNADIDEQMKELNKCFRGGASGKAKPANLLFERVRAGDSKIRFVLEGIRTKKTATNIWSPIDKIFYPFIKSEDQGGCRPYKPEKTLNVWITDGLILDERYNPIAKNIIAGISSFPSNQINLNTDGIVLQSSVISTASGNPRVIINPVDGSENIVTNRSGRTLAHEVGHYLGLHHLVGALGIGCGDDAVDDTPPTERLHFGSYFLPFSEKCDNVSNSQMFMNLMDYTNDDVRYMFSKGQVNKMWTTCFYGTVKYRQSLIN